MVGKPASSETAVPDPNLQNELLVGGVAVHAARVLRRLSCRAALDVILHVRSARVQPSGAVHQAQHLQGCCVSLSGNTSLYTNFISGTPATTADVLSLHPSLTRTYPHTSMQILAAVSNDMQQTR